VTLIFALRKMITLKLDSEITYNSNVISITFFRSDDCRVLAGRGGAYRAFAGGRLDGALD
jgi:hypothetical protein